MNRLSGNDERYAMARMTAKIDLMMLLFIVCNAASIDNILKYYVGSFLMKYQSSDKGQLYGRQQCSSPSPPGQSHLLVHHTLLEIMHTNNLYTFSVQYMRILFTTILTIDSVTKE